MRVTQLVEFCSGTTATVLNLLLIPIILTKSSQRIGKYKWFLLAYTINACYFTTSQFSALVTWYIPTNGYFFISTVDLMPRWVQQIQVMSFVSSYTFNAIILTWSFLYRLYIIESPRPWLVRWPYFPLGIFLSILLACYMVGSCKSIMPSDEVDHIFRDELFNATGIETKDVGYIGGEITINGSINIGMAICLGSYIVFVFTACTIFLICWHKIGSKLREIRNVASLNYRFQYHLYVLLTLQTCMPIIFNIFPAFIVFVLSLSKIPCGEVILLCSMVVSFAQICDPIFTVLLIADYREALSTWRRRACRTIGMDITTGISMVSSSAVNPTSIWVTRHDERTFI